MSLCTIKTQFPIQLLFFSNLLAVTILKLNISVYEFVKPWTSRSKCWRSETDICRKVSGMLRCSLYAKKIINQNYEFLVKSNTITNYKQIYF